MQLLRLKNIDETINLTERKPVWIALSDFYLDNELQPYTFKYIAETIIESPYSLEEVKTINKYEIFPVLQSNLLNIAGEWAGFNEEWLVETILISLYKRNKLRQFTIEWYYWAYKWMCADYWEELEAVYSELLTNKTKK